MRQYPVFLVLGAVAVACGSASNGGSGGDGGPGSGSSGGGHPGGDDAGSPASPDDASTPVAPPDGGSAVGPSDGAVTTVSSGDGGLVTYGKPYTDGAYNLGPVDYSETQFHNACAPGTKYDPRVQQAEGTLLAGLWDGIPNTDSYCDACIWVVTDKGKSGMLRVVTYGDTTTDSIDVSPEAYSFLNVGEYPRSMTWQFAKCPDTGAMMYEFQTGSSEYWTSLWVRNARVPLAKIEVQSKNHSSWTELMRGAGDGTVTDAMGFGAGTFSIRSTGLDGQQVVDTFDWPSSGIAGAFLTGKGNFQ